MFEVRNKTSLLAFLNLLHILSKALQAPEQAMRSGAHRSDFQTKNCSNLSISNRMEKQKLN